MRRLDVAAWVVVVAAGVVSGVVVWAAPPGVPSVVVTHGEYVVLHDEYGPYPVEQYEGVEPVMFLPAAAAGNVVRVGGDQTPGNAQAPLTLPAAVEIEDLSTADPDDKITVAPAATVVGANSWVVKFPAAVTKGGVTWDVFRAGHWHRFTVAIKDANGAVVASDWCWVYVSGN